MTKKKIKKSYISDYDIMRLFCDGKTQEIKDFIIDGSIKITQKSINDLIILATTCLDFDKDFFQTLIRYAKPHSLNKRNITKTIIDSYNYDVLLFLEKSGMNFSLREKLITLLSPYQFHSTLPTFKYLCFNNHISEKLRNDLLGLAIKIGLKDFVKFIIEFDKPIRKNILEKNILLSIEYQKNNIFKNLYQYSEDNFNNIVSQSFKYRSFKIIHYLYYSLLNKNDEVKHFLEELNQIQLSPPLDVRDKFIYDDLLIKANSDYNFIIMNQKIKDF